MSEWRKYTLEELADDITVGFVGSMASEYIEGGIPFLRSLNVEPLRINQNDLKYISPEFHRRIKKSRLTPGDVVIVRTGKPGACAVVPAWLSDANCSDLVIVRCGSKINNQFLAYYINTVSSGHVASHIVGAVQQHFNVGAARTLPVYLPPLDEQRAIVATLAAFDEKIELNRKMNETLDGIARAIFKDWFVDFGPTRAKMAGTKPYLTTEVWNLFPNGLSVSGNPNGWKQCSIYEIAEVVYGAPFASTQFNTEKEGIPLIRIRDLPAESPGVWTTEVHPKGYIVKPGDIVVGMDGEFRAYLWGGMEAWLNQRVCVFAPKDGFSAAFVRSSIIDLLAEVEATEIATTVIHLGKNDIDRFMITMPPDDIVERFNQLAQPMYDRIVANKIENHRLTITRDLLLPKLMSGEIRLRDAALTAEAVLAKAT